MGQDMIAAEFAKTVIATAQIRMSFVGNRLFCITNRYRGLYRVENILTCAGTTADNSSLIIKF
jgi:hypothetical protein